MKDITSKSDQIIKIVTRAFRRLKGHKSLDYAAGYRDALTIVWEDWVKYNEERKWANKLTAAEKAKEKRLREYFAHGPNQQ